MSSFFAAAAASQVAWRRTVNRVMGWHQTSGVKLSKGCWARFCAFKTKVFARGKHAHVHKGKLFKPFEESKVVVKVLQVVDDCRAEMEKQKLADNVLKTFPAELKNVRLVLTYPACVSQVAFLHKWFSRDPLEVGAPVLIQDRVDTQDFRRFPSPAQSDFRALPLLKLARKTLTLSRGRYVIVGTKGFVTKEKGVVIYWLTSLVVHSTDQSLGRSDEGPSGIERFLQMSGLGASFPPPPLPFQLSAPPFDESLPAKEEKADEVRETTGKETISGCVYKRALADTLTELSAESDLPPPYHSVVRAAPDVVYWGLLPPYMSFQMAA